MQENGSMKTKIVDKVVSEVYIYGFFHFDIFTQNLYILLSGKYNVVGVEDLSYEI